MFLISLALQLGLIWFFITLFTRQTDSSQSMRESLIVLAGYFVASLLCQIFLGAILGYLVILIEVAVLYFLVEKVCGTRRPITMRICGWYLGSSILINLGMGLLLS